MFDLPMAKGTWPPAMCVERKLHPGICQLTLKEIILPASPMPVIYVARFPGHDKQQDAISKETIILFCRTKNGVAKHKSREHKPT